jgi:hypothetical protein
VCATRLVDNQKKGCLVGSVTIIREISLPADPNVLAATQSTSSPNRERPSDLGRVDLALISKRKAALSPEGASRPQKLARTDTRMSLTETDVPSRSQHLFVSKAGILLSPTTKTLKKKVHLKRNHELVHSLVKSGHGTSNILSINGCQWVIVAR